MILNSVILLLNDTAPPSTQPMALARKSSSHPELFTFSYLLNLITLPTKTIGPILPHLSL